MEFEAVFGALLFLAFVGILLAIVLAAIALYHVSALRKELYRLRYTWESSRPREGVSQAPHPAARAVPDVAPSAVPPAPAAAPPPVAAISTPPAPPPRPPAAVPAPALPYDDLRSLESRIGQRWIAWVGAIVVFFSVVFFLRYAFQNAWIGPTGQVVISALGGTVLAATGSFFVGKSWRILGQCLMGLGLAILYAAFYAAFAIYDPPIMSQPTAFGFMIAVTIAGMALAVMHDALSMAFLATLGGILTPVLLSTGQDARDTLFTYLLLLDLGVIGVAFFRGWRILDGLAMAGSFILYAGWWSKFYRPEGLGPALAWLAAFYLIFLILPFLYHLVRRREITLERFIMAVVNAAFAGGFAWYMLRDDYLFTMGFVALGMAAAYLALGAAIRRLIPGDARALFGAIAMTVTFLTLAVPMQLRAEGITLAWVAEAPVLAYLAFRFQYAPLRAFAAVVLVVAVGRLFLSDVHWPLHDGLFVPFANRRFLSALAVPAAAGVYALVHQWFAARGSMLDRVLKLITALGGGILTLIICHAEVRGWLNNDFDEYAAACGVAALWALGSLAYMLAGTIARRAAPWVWGVGVFALAWAMLLGIATYGEDAGTQHLLFANARFAAGLLIVLVLFGYTRAMHRLSGDAAAPIGGAAITFLIAALVGLLALLSAEVYSFCTDVITDDAIRARRAGQMSITLVWGLYAAVMLYIGFWRRRQAMRLAGLSLFGLAAVKLVVVDLGFLQDVYRIVSFLVLGVLMLGASYLYHKLEKRLAAGRSDAAPAAGPAAGGSP